MANRYWVGRGTFMSDLPTQWNNTSNWSSTSGGSGGSSVPTISDDVFIDANSFTGANQGIYMDFAGSCNNMNWTGATYTPQFTGAQSLTIGGSLTFISNMTVTLNSALIFRAGSGNYTITTAGVSMPNTSFQIDANGGANYSFVGTTDFASLMLYNGIVNTNNNTITSKGVFRVIAQGNSGRPLLGSDYRSLTLGTSVISTPDIYFMQSSASTVISSASATVNLVKNASFSESVFCYFIGGHSLSSLVITGTANTTFSGTLTVTTFTVEPATRIVFFASGSVINVTNITCSGTAGNVIELKASSGTWSINASSGTKSVDFVKIKDSQASGGAKWVAGYNSVDSGNNTGWLFLGKSNSIFFGAAF